MPKSKSKKNRDFQKVRFKVGKKLPKAANYTETRFKVAQIKVHQKLHHDVDVTEPTTRRKLNFKDLISQLHHHSCRVRADAITGLLELLNADESIAVTQLPLLITNLAPIFYDSDSDARRMGATLFRKIISVLSMPQLSPFVRTIFAHLGCAMTHIDEPIQLDSLKFIDTFIDGPPQLLGADSGTILKNFIELIAKYHSSSSSISLVADPVSKRASQKWRQKILKRLEKFLSIQLAALSESPRNDESVDIKCDGTSAIYYTPWSAASRQLEARLTLSTSSHGSDVAAAVIVDYTPKLLHLLRETWTDVAPCRQRKHRSQGVTVQSDTCVTLMAIANVTKSLLSVQSIGKSDHPLRGRGSSETRDELTRLCGAMMRAFPVSQLAKKDPTAKSKGKVICMYVDERVFGRMCKFMKKKNVSSSHLNLTVCDVICRALEHAGPSPGFARASVELAVGYVRDVSDADVTPPITELATILSICDRLLENDARDVLDVVWSLYERAHHLSQQKKTLLVYVTKLITQPRFKLYLSHSSFPSFARSLPDALASAAGTDRALETALLDGLKVACRHGMLDMSEHLDILIDVLPRILPQNVRPSIDLFYRCPTIDRESYARLSRLLTLQRLPKDTSTYLIHVLQYRCNSGCRDVETVRDYLSFAATVLLGRLTGYCGDAVGHERRLWVIAPLSKDLEAYYVYHYHISRDICEHLGNLLCPPLADPFLSKLLISLSGCVEVNIWSVAALFHFCNAFHPTDVKNAESISQLAVAVTRSLVSNNAKMPPEIGEKLFEDVARFLCVNDDVSKNFWISLKDFVERDDFSFEEGQDVCTILLRLVQMALFPVMRLDKSYISDILLIIQSKYGEVTGHAVWSELQYALSVI